MDYKDLLIETMEMDDNTLKLAEKIATDFEVKPLWKGELRECVCSLKEHYFDVPLSSEILRATYEKIVRKAVSELQAIDSEFDWDIDGVNSKITCYGKVVNKWQDIVDMVATQKRLMEKLRSEILARYPYFTPKVIDAIIEDVPLEDIIYNFEIDNIRVCSECGCLMDKGYCIEDGQEYYCSDDCLRQNMTDEEYNKLYDNGNGDTYWTEW